MGSPNPVGYNKNKKNKVFMLGSKIIKFIINFLNLKN